MYSCERIYRNEFVDVLYMHSFVYFAIYSWILDIYDGLLIY